MTEHNVKFLDGKDPSKELLGRTRTSLVFRPNGQNAEVAIHNLEVAIQSLKIAEVVEELPETGEPNRLYLLLRTDGEDGNLFDEYLWIDHVWELIGSMSSEIDLTSYVRKDNETPYNIVGDYNPTHKLYVDGKIDPLVEKIDDLQLFKFPNATIIGEPIINNGQVSGFSQNAYLKFPFLVDFNSKPFEINMEFTTGANIQSQENIFDSDFGLAFAIRSGKFVIAISTNGTSWNLGEGVGTHTVQAKTTYRVKLSWDRMTYRLAYSTDGGKNYTEDITKVGAFQPAPKQIYIGAGENFGEVFNWFTGIINMNHCTLAILGQVIWQGMDDAGLATRLETDLSNIDADGINYINNLIDEKINALDAREVSY